MGEEQVNVTAEPEVGAPEGSTQAQPETSSQSPDWEALLEERLQSRLAEREQALITRFNQELAKRDQSRDDQLLNRVQKRLGPKLDLYEEVAKEEGWDPAKLSQKKQAALAQEFQAALKETPPKPVQPIPTYETVSAGELEGYIRSKGLDPADVPYAKYIGLRKDDPQGVNFLVMVENAASTKKDAAKQAKTEQKVERAKEVAAVKEKFGGTATPQGAPGGSVSAESLEEEYQKLVSLKSVPLAERHKVHQRMDEIEAKLKELGRWA